MKTDKNRIYQCDRLYYPRFLAGIMKATVIFSHYSATHLISIIWSTKATQIFLTLQSTNTNMCSLTCRGYTIVTSR